MRRSLCLIILAIPLAAWADEFDGTKPLTTDQIAKVKADQELRKQQIIDQDKGDDTYDGLHAAKKAIRNSLQESLDANGVDRTQYMRELTHADKATRAEIEEKVHTIKEQKNAEREAAAKGEPPAKPAEPEAAKPAEPEDQGPEIVRGFDGEPGADGKLPSVTVPSKVGADGERTPEIILGYDEDHPPGGESEKPPELPPQKPVSVDPAR